MLNFFLSYSHHDSTARDELKNSLNPYILRGRINFWYDPDLLAGDKVTPEISKQMNDANVFLLLISRNFMGSEYIIKYELKAAAEKFKKNDGCRIIPIILEDISLKFLEEEFGELLNPLPQTNAKVLKPLNKWKKNESDTAWKIILTELEKIIFGENSGSIETNNQTKTENVVSVEGGNSRSNVAAAQQQAAQNIPAAEVSQNNSIAAKILSNNNAPVNDIKIPEADLKNMIADYIFQNPEMLLKILQQSKQQNGN